LGLIGVIIHRTQKVGKPKSAYERQKMRERDKFYNQPNQKKKSTNHYVDNRKFYEAIKDYKAQCALAESKGREKPRISDYIGKCIWLITENLARKPKFMNYSFIEEMKSDAIENCFMYFDNFNTVKYDNPFAYFTQITNYAFLRRIGTEEKKRYVIYKTFQESLIGIDQGLLVDHDDKPLTTPQMYDNLNDFIKRFEEKEEAKKAKRKEKREGLERFTENDEENTGTEHTIPDTTID